MKIFQWAWVVCVASGYIMVPIGMAITYVFFKQLENAYPNVFNLSMYPVFGFRKPLKYWQYILMGKYKELDRGDMIFRCRVLRFFLLAFLVVFIISIIGLFLA